MPPEYFEYTRLRDVFDRDLWAITAMIETVTVQRQLLNRLSSRDTTYTARGALDSAIENLSLLHSQLTGEKQQVCEHLQRIREEVGV